MAKRPKQPLVETHPELAGELVHAEDGQRVSSGSSTKLLWRCKLGHEWEADPNSRTRRGNGCSVCSNHQVLAGYNDIATTHPQLASELADQSLATQITVGSHRKVAWVCAKNGHTWETFVFNRSTHGTGCVYCAGKAVLAGFNDLATTHPEMAEELANPADAFKVTAGSGRKVKWRCRAHGHEWLTSAVKRISRGFKCPICSNFQVLPGFNDLATTHPHLVEELVDPEVATRVTAGSKEVLQWKCKALGHVWSVVVYSRVNNQTGCPICSNHQLLVGYNDLATTHPQLASELAKPELATTFQAGTPVEVEWVCVKHGHRWVTRVSTRTKFGCGCPICAGQRVLAGFNDLATTHPHLVEELADPSIATRVTAGSGAKLTWVCRKDPHTYETTVTAKTKHGNGCGICNGKQVLAGFNDLATTHPHLVEELVNPNDAKKHTAGSGKRLLWKCHLEHQWRTTPVARCKYGTGCPTCANKIILAGFNDLGTTHPHLTAELADPNLAVTLSCGSRTRAAWICSLGHTWEATVASRSGGSSKIGSGCPSCTPRGFRPADPGLVYFLISGKQSKPVAQFGVSNAPRVRLRTHRRSGFEQAGELMLFETGQQALELETAIKLALRDAGVPSVKEENTDTFDGYTEAFYLEHLEAGSLNDLLSKLNIPIPGSVTPIDYETASRWWACPELKALNRLPDCLTV